MSESRRKTEFPDEVEEGRGSEPRSLPDDLAVLPPADRAPVLDGLAVVAPDGVDTLLANVGCLCVFQVAGNDARQLTLELDRDRVSVEDIVSLPVHHCYVRATVGTAGVTVPLWVSHEALVCGEGPLGRAWLNLPIREPASLPTTVSLSG